MEIITADKLRDLLENGHISVSISAGGDTVEISPRLFLSINFNAPASCGELSHRGYFVETGEKTRRCKSFDTMLAYIKKLGVVVSGTVEVRTFDGRFETVRDMLDERAFNALDDAAIVDKYRDMADTFELIAPFDAYTGSFPYFTAKLDRTAGERVIDRLVSSQRAFAREIYENKLSDGQRAALPPFERLIDGISSECEAHAQDVKCGRAGDKSPFMCDLVYSGDVKYPEPCDAMWHLYHSADFLRDNIALVKALADNKEEKSMTRELDDAFFAPLRAALISVEPAFEWHCTLSGLLHKVFRFRLTNETADWLKANYAECIKRGLEDLAFYKGDKMLYSSCTHEGFRTDHSKTAMSR